MGTKPAPSYADNFMARRIDDLIIGLAQNYKISSRIPLTIFKIFLDDIFSIFIGPSIELHKLFDEMSNLDKSITFTMNHTSLPNKQKKKDASVR